MRSGIYLKVARIFEKNNVEMDFDEKKRRRKKHCFRRCFQLENASKSNSTKTSRKTFVPSFLRKNDVENDVKNVENIQKRRKRRRKTFLTSFSTFFTFLTSKKNS